MSSCVIECTRTNCLEINPDLYVLDGKPYVKFKAPKMEQRTISNVKANAAVSKLPAVKRQSASEKAQVERKRSSSAPSCLAERLQSKVRVVRTGKTSGPGKVSSFDLVIAYASFLRSTPQS